MKCSCLFESKQFLNLLTPLTILTLFFQFGLVLFFYYYVHRRLAVVLFCGFGTWALGIFYT